MERAAIQYLMNVEKANTAVEADLAKLKGNPVNQVFNLKYRIMNTEAFRHYRSIFLLIESK